MKRDYTLLFIGVWIILLPFLGFPPSWEKMILIITGLGIVFLGYMFWYERIKKGEEVVVTTIFE